MTDDMKRPSVTYHLTPRTVWERQARGPDYRPEAYEVDGFIHCTNGEENLLGVANQFYTGDEREQIVLVIDVASIKADVRYEDADRIFPHIYGPVNVDAVIALRTTERASNGAFTRVGDALDN